MPPDLARRCALILFASMAIAIGCGLFAVPAFDPLAVMQQLPAPLGVLALVAHGVVAWLSTEMTRVYLARRVDQRFDAPMARRLQWGLIVAALGWWVYTGQLLRAGDARALMWLELLPLWLGPAGLVRRRSGQGWAGMHTTVLGTQEFAQHFHHDTRSMDQVDMGSGGHMTLLGTRQPSRARRKHHVVAPGAVAAEQRPA